jgi:hypothetical protein
LKKNQKAAKECKDAQELPNFIDGEPVFDLTTPEGSAAFSAYTAQWTLEGKSSGNKEKGKK